MKNGQKYAKEINQMVNQEYFECSLWSIRNGKRASEDCRHIPESFDPVSGRDEFCKKCLGESLEWLNQEYKEPILTEQEKDIIRHFMEAYSSICSKIVKVIKTGSFNVVCLKFLSGSTSSICSVNCVTISPEISKDVMFKGMELNVAYTLEELGL